MKTNSVISVAVALAFSVAWLGMDAPARGQTPGEPNAQPKINLTLEQRFVIKELIKDLKPPLAPQNGETNVGATVPSTISLSPMPPDVAAKVPQVKSHLFFLKDNKVVIVDPKENKIVDAID